MTSPLVFGKYEVVKKIAVGGMGEVFLARRGDRRVTLKTCSAAEAELIARLKHPNVVAILDAGDWDGKPCIALEYLEGWNLAQLLRRARELRIDVSPWIVAWMIRDAARGLHHAHTLGIVHRDVSPQNLVVRKDAVVKVVDFGVATGALTAAPNTFVGKSGYLAPEQLTGDTLDARSDQYSLGVVFWELLAARRLHGDIRSDELPPLPKEVPEALGTIARRMLETSPALRYPRCDEVGRALDEALKPKRDTEEALVALIARLGPVPADTTDVPSVQPRTGLLATLRRKLGR